MPAIRLVIWSGLGLFLAAAATLEAAQAMSCNESTPEDMDPECYRSALIIDTHIDTPYRIEESWDDVSTATGQGDFDYPRAKAGGLDIPFFSIYTPADTEAAGSAYQLANQLIDGVEALAGRAPDKFMLVTTVADARAAHQGGKIGLAMGMENGAPIAGELKNLEHFYQRGIRYITLTHSKSNHISDSSYDQNRQWQGLSDFGKQIVAEMNRLGMMIDVSHVSDEAFYQVLELSQAPVIASHSSARHFTPGWERNMSDDMIRKLAAGGGVIQINFGSTFISQKALDWYNRFDAARAEFLVINRWDRNSDAAREYELDYRQQQPFPYASVADVADHFDHVISLVGDDYVGLGSDFDGVGDSLPLGLKSVADYPNLVAEFQRRGYSPNRIRKILGLNLLRVWRAVEAHASAAGNDDDSG